MPPPLMPRPITTPWWSRTMEGRCWSGPTKRVPAPTTASSTTRMAAALDVGLQSSGIGTFDLIAFDTCLMASLEAVSAVYPFASYMIASEEISYSGAFNYGGFGYLATAENPTVDGLGESLLAGFIDYLEDVAGGPIGT